MQFPLKLTFKILAVAPKSNYRCNQIDFILCKAKTLQIKSYYRLL
jgi:hypothetical protein